MKPYIFILVAIGSLLSKQRTTDWNNTLWVVVYPINGDGSATTQAYIDSLDAETFKPIESFINSEAKRYGIKQKKSISMRLSAEVKDIPPKPPYGGSGFAVMYWSLKLRYWAWSTDNYQYPKDIQIFVIYFDPDIHKRVAHSLGLQKGLLGIVNAFSGERLKADNNVIITHELLHTVGATDKYDLTNNQPIYPSGYADPNKDPLYPQKQAEIMAGRIPKNENTAEIPKELKYTVIGKATAAEIHWLNK